MKKFLKFSISIILSVYLLICLLLYLLQSRLLFPTHLAAPVTQQWRPSISNLDEQALIDGQCGKLHVVHWRVPNAKSTVMIFHGNTESIASVESYVPWLQKFGLSVMVWDYAGYGQSKSCILGNEAQMLQDSESAYQWLASRVTKDKITLFGRSIGTGLAVHVASQHLVHRLILVSPYDSLVNVSQDHVPFFIPARLLSRYPLHADAWIGQVKCPIFAVHGTLDTLIKPEHAQQLMRHAPKNASLKWIAGAGHDVASSEAYEQWLTALLMH